MEKKYKISVGICAKNEEFVISQCLNSVLLNLKNLNYIWDIHICINGSSDNTLNIVQDWINQNDGIYTSIYLSLLNEANLVEAQRLIREKSLISGSEAVVFVDADTILDKDCISNLLGPLFIEKSLIATYAMFRPILPSSTFIERVLNNYDQSTLNVFSTGKHLHGRVFATKKWDIPKTFPPLIADDIYLSFYYLYTYGEKSIKKIPNAIVYFQQIKTLSDMYQAYKRRSIELKKIKMLFPHFFTLPLHRINRQFSYKSFLKDTMYHKFLWISLYILRLYCKYKLKFDHLFNNSLLYQWEEVKSSKETLGPPFLILLEGLDCSGKKTLARNLEKRFSYVGLGCKLHTGPFGPQRYTKLIHLVTIHKCPDFLRSRIFTWEPYLQTSQPQMSGIIIQISSSLRSISYAKLHKEKVRNFINKILPLRLPKFDVVFYLEANFKDRVKRHYLQNLIHENQDNVKKRFPSEKFFDELNKELKGALEHYYSDKYLASYNTSIEHISSIENKIFFLICKKFKYSFIERERYSTLTLDKVSIPVHQVYVRLIDKDNNVLIVSENSISWQLPGGKPERGESVITTCIREVQEETGLDIYGYKDNIQLFGYYNITEGILSKDHHYKIENYLQIRMVLHVDQFTIKENVNNGNGENIKYVRKVPMSEVSKYIPRILGREEFYIIKQYHNNENCSISA